MISSVGSGANPSSNQVIVSVRQSGINCTLIKEKRWKVFDHLLHVRLIKEKIE